MTPAYGRVRRYIACHYGHAEAAHLLLEASADINIATADNGRTPLYTAAKNGFTNIAQMLVDAGADVDRHTTDHKRTPLIVCSAEGNIGAATSTSFEPTFSRAPQRCTPAHPYRVVGCAHT